MGVGISSTSQNRYAQAGMSASEEIRVLVSQGYVKIDAQRHHAGMRTII
jgi:hypothetical protein